MPVEWAQAAVADLKAIYDYLDQHNPQVAARSLHAIRSKTVLLEQFPALGQSFNPMIRRVNVAGTPYLIMYLIRSNGIYVVRIFDSRQDWQGQINDT